MNDKKIGLALSGGGYRAAAFHLGVLKKLKELKILDNINIISTVSGGSIIGAFYLLNKDNFEDFENKFRKLLRYNIQYRLYGTLILIVSMIFTFNIYFTYYFLNECSNFWFYLICSIFLTFLLCFILFFKIIPSNKILNFIYKNKFFTNKNLSDFPKEPKIIINSSNLETGTILSFSRDIVKDSTYKYKTGLKREIEINTSLVDVSFAVTASSAFSPLFQPLKFKKNHFAKKEDHNIFHPLLIDGGVYDNQGIHNIGDSDEEGLLCNTIICSDCSQPYKLKYNYLNPYSLLKKTIDFLMRRIRNFQFQHFIYRKCAKAENIAYFSIGWSFETCIDGFVNSIINHSERRNQLIESHNVADKVIKDREILKEYIKEKIKYEKIIPEKFKNYNFDKFKDIKTNLKPLDIDTENDLIEYASILCDIQIKLYCNNQINI